ncbi:primosomal protein N' [Thermodesulfobacteriota bacterium]
MGSDSPYIEVAVALPVYGTFTYRVTDGFLPFAAVGKRVLVPFGERRVTGYILGQCDATEPDEIKSILDILDEKPIFSSSMIPFLKWVADYYVHPIGQVIKCALPGGLSTYEVTNVKITDKGRSALRNCSSTPLEEKILRRLAVGPCRLKDFYQEFQSEIPRSLIYVMERSGWIERQRILKRDRTKPKMERYVALFDANISVEPFSQARKNIIEILKSENEISVKDLKEVVPTAARHIKPLEKSGYIRVYQRRIYRDPFGEPIEPDTMPVLTQEQKNAVTSVSKVFDQGFSAYLLTGVTGSGKTEVYMRLAAETIKRNGNVLILVPEIALISQMEKRFRARFGECIAVFHSGLSAGERYDQWRRVLDKEASIGIGARSAIFAPFENLGLIIVDEEHDPSYKQESHLRYNARDLALVRAQLQNSIALLGSATPSMQSYYNVKTNKFREITLSERVENRPLPEITVVDLRETRDTRGIKRFITADLLKAMKETLGRREQVLLFINRRGFANFPVCAACGSAVSCKNCDISLTMHRRANAFKCHYCGYSRAAHSQCPSCGSSQIKLLGIGTEKVEEAVRRLFPDANITRMDRDTTTRKGSILAILKGLQNHSTDILVGTQIVAKGHDFPNITLVGIICADLSLNFPDFRAGERTFQILAQVAGRAGRGEVPGRVILQTYNPEHFSILAAKQQDFRSFYDQEIHYRKALKYPPFSRLVQLKISGKEMKKTGEHARIIGSVCHKLRQRSKFFLNSIEVLGPIEAPLQKIARRYRWQILLKGSGVKPLHTFLRQLLFENRSLFKRREVKVVVDVDPFFMM